MDGQSGVMQGGGGKGARIVLARSGFWKVSQRVEKKKGSQSFGQKTTVGAQRRE